MKHCVRARRESCCGTRARADLWLVVGLFIALPGASLAAPASVLLVDDDESDNNNYPGDTRLSASDSFYRNLLKSQGRAFNAIMVPRYKSGPDIAALRPYSLVVWYTGASYGGNPDNTAVISLDDEKAIQQYLTETGGTLILISPGYMSNALGANVDSHWGNMTSEFLTKVMGIKGGRGLLGRFDAGQVTSAGGTTFPVTKNPAVETQFSALNPDSATPIFTSPLNPDGKGAQPTAVAIRHAVGKGTLVYVGFTLENVSPSGSLAFDTLLQPADGPRTSKLTQPAETSRTPQPMAIAQVTDAPRSFSVTGSDHDSVSFEASAAGPVRVQVQSQGVPVVVAILHPDGRRVERSGTGSFLVDDSSSAADLAKGHIWAVTVRAATATPASNVVASGTLTVSHPPADKAAVQAQLAARPAPARPVSMAVTAPTRKISATEIKTLNGQMATLSAAAIPAPVPAGSPLINATATVIPGVMMVQATAPAAAPAVPLPVITGLSVSEASPGTELKISGTNMYPPDFPPGKMTRTEVTQYPKAEVHFVLADGVDRAVLASPHEYSVPVPGSFGQGRWVQEHYLRIPSMPSPDSVGSVYIKTADGRISNRLPFTFHPKIVDAALFQPISNGQLLDGTLDRSYPNADLSNGRVRRDTYLLGFKGDDTFYSALQLSSVWKVVSCHVVIAHSMNGGAEVSECRPGTNSPFVKVHWYLDPTLLFSNDVSYGIKIVVRGPEGMPFF